MPGMVPKEQMPITVVSIVRSGHAHSGAYQDLADTLRYGLERGGDEVRIADGLEGLAGRAIVLGAHLADRGALADLPGDTIIYNTEHASSAFIDDAYLDLLRRLPVWDCSRDNASALEARLGKPVLYVTAGYVPELARVPSLPEEDVDVLFYGSMNSRRQMVLDRLRATGVRVEAVFGLYGAARDALIARAKLVLNIHFYEPGHFEVLRVSYLMANGKAVVTELNPGETIDADLAAGLAAAPYAALVDTVLSLIGDDAARRALARAGRDAFRSRDETAILRSALATTWGDAAAGAAPPAVLPKRLTVGSGKMWSADALNIDIDPRWNPDIVADITDAGVLDATFATARFGSARLPRGYFTDIAASHLLEHLHDLVGAMTNCLDLLAEGGLLHVTVPYDLSYGAWQDPTHVRAFNERSWWYYCDGCWYIGWTEARFDRMTLAFVFSEIGEALRSRGVPDQEILRTPRAVDEMRVVLRKRKLTEAEQAYGRSMRGAAR